MDPNRLKNAYQRLELLDERLTHRLRPRLRGSLMSPGIDQLAEHNRHLTEFTLELKEIVRELVLSFAKAPEPPASS